MKIRAIVMIVVHCVATTSYGSWVTRLKEFFWGPIEKKVELSLPLVASPSLVPLTICEAVYKGTQFFKMTPENVEPAGEQQKQFVDTQYLPYLKDKTRSYFTSDELVSYASTDEKVLNKVLEAKGFSIRFSKLGPGHVGILAIQDIFIAWLKEGRRVTVQSMNKKYDGVELTHATYLKDKGQSVSIVQLATQSGDTVYLAVQPETPLFADTPTDQEISERLAVYRNGIRTGSFVVDEQSFETVQFPMIEYRVQPDVSWLEKMRIGTGLIAQAIQEVIFKMNEKGARAQVATGLILETAMPPRERKILVVDQPFLVWIERKGVSMPIFAGYMQQKYWKNPGVL